MNDPITPQTDLERLRLAMIQRGISNQDLAEQIGMGASLLSLKMNGRRPISDDERVAIAGALGLAVETIFMEPQEIAPPTETAS